MPKILIALMLSLQVATAQEAVESTESAALPEEEITTEDRRESAPPTAALEVMPKSAPAPAKSVPASKKLVLLPLVTFFDNVEGDVYNWWAENSTDARMKKLSQKILGDLSREQGRWNYLQRDQLIPATRKDWQATVLSLTQMVEFAKQRGAHLVITGDLMFTRSPLIENGVRLKTRLEVYRVQNGEKVAEVLRLSDYTPEDYNRVFYETTSAASQAFQDIHQQLENYHALKKRNYVSLFVSGSLSHLQLERLKSRIQQNVPGVSSLREISFENEQVQILVEYEGEGTALFGKTLSQAEFPDFMTQVVSSDASQVLFDVKYKER